MDRAFLELYGVKKALAGVTLSGKTDPQIYQEVLSAKGLDPDLVPFRQKYFHNLREELPRSDGYARVLPGVAELLDRLAARSDCLLGLLTGNWRTGAEVKLGYFGIHHFFRFGAFGDDGADRLELPAVARRRAARLLPAATGPGTAFYVVGDTPRDIACALGADCIAVAVATGEYDEAHLAGCHPHHLFSSLAETDRFFADLGIAG